MLEAIRIRSPGDFTRSVAQSRNVIECVLLQTCHRVEIYSVVSSSITNDTLKNIIGLWSAETGVSTDLIAKTTTILNGKEALRHLFYLAAGLESVVLGEDQIIGQVRAAYLKAQANRTIGLILDKSFMKAINIGRKVRTETRVNEGSVSISSAAVDMAESELGDLGSKSALIIGAGEAGRLAAEALRGRTGSPIYIANRTLEKSRAIAEKISGKAIPFSDFISTIPAVDLVIAAVSVTKPLLREEQVTKLTFPTANSKRTLLIDISQPRAIDEKIQYFKGFCLKNIDDVKGLVAANLKNRQVEAEKSKVILEQELRRFEEELAGLVAQPIIVGMCYKFEQIRKRELARAVRKMGESDEKKLGILDRFSRELIERISQIPIKELKGAAINNNSDLLSAAETLFQIEGLTNSKEE